MPDKSRRLDERQRFIEDFAMQWSLTGSSLMNGRVLGFLLIADDEYVSSLELVRELGASQGSISASTRALLGMGVIHRRSFPGDRSHYFTADSDPWGTVLRDNIEQQLALQRSLHPNDELRAQLGEDAIARLRNAVDYYTWILGRREALAEEWEEFKRLRDERD